MTSFAELGLSENALRAVEALGYDTPTPVQKQAIPLVLQGVDIIAAAKTGTGKTAAFSLPCLDRVAPDKRRKAPRALVVTPTRELANQIAEVCATIAAISHHRVATVVGGVAIDPQIKRLKKGVDLLIATPGRLIDLMNQKAVSLDDVEVLVLDEADRMLDMGFLPDMRKIVAATPQTRQTLLFSATVDSGIRKQMDSLLREPHIIQIASKGETADTVEQYIVRIPHSMKFDLLKAALKTYGHRRVIVFARTRHRADSTCRRLKRLGYHVEALHSDRSQNQRQRALRNFADGETDILVATDVLARGIDVENVAYVVNFDLPTVAEDYVHRIGRTGRAGSQGFALSFVSPETEDALVEIQKFIKTEIPVREVEGFSLQEAAEEAAARATRASARKDPELAEAAREMKKKERRKEKAREKAIEEAREAQGRTKAGAKTRKPKRTKRKAANAASPARTNAAKPVAPKPAATKPANLNPDAPKADASKPSVLKPAAPKPGSPKRTAPKPATSKSATSKKSSSKKGRTKGGNSSKPKHNAGKSRANSASAATRAAKRTAAANPDMRPGRAQRAARSRKSTR